MASVTGNRNPQIMGQGGPGPQTVNNPMMQQQIQQQQQQHPQQMPNMMQQSRMPMVIVSLVIFILISF